MMGMISLPENMNKAKVLENRQVERYMSEEPNSEKEVPVLFYLKRWSISNLDNIISGKLHETGFIRTNL